MYSSYHDVAIPEQSVDIVKPLEDVVMKEMGRTACFECQLSCEIADVAWLKNGRPLTEDKRHRITQDGTIYKLTISHVEPDDAAEYTFSCRRKTTKANLIPKSKFVFRSFIDSLIY